MFHLDLPAAFEIAASRRDDRPSVALEAVHGDAAYLAQALLFCKPATNLAFWAASLTLMVRWAAF